MRERKTDRDRCIEYFAIQEDIPPEFRATGSIACCDVDIGSSGRERHIFSNIVGNISKHCSTRNVV